MNLVLEHVVDGGSVSPLEEEWLWDEVEKRLKLE